MSAWIATFRERLIPAAAEIQAGIRERLAPLADWLEHRPFLINLRHHGQVLRAALDEERDNADLRRAVPGEHERAFLPAILEVTETPASPLGRKLALAIATFFAIAVLWAVVGEIDVVASAQGKIIPSGKVKLIQPLESGIVLAIRVEDGQAVRQGETLIELDPTGADADRDRLKNEWITAEAEAARLEALLAPNPEKAYRPPVSITPEVAQMHRRLLASQWREHQAKVSALGHEADRRQAEIASISADLKRVEAILPKVRTRTESRRGLVERGFAPRLEHLKQEQELSDYEGQREVQKSKLAETRAALAGARSQKEQAIEEFRRDIMVKLDDARRRSISAEKEFAKASERSRVQKLLAPVDGTVQQLAVNTVGGVVTPAQQLMVIVPSDSRLEIEVMIQNKDIGFVEEGQEAVVKLESFPFTKYGMIEGHVLSVSRDAVQDENKGLIYPARVALAKTVIAVENKLVNLGPGMSATVEIKTDSRRLIEYLLAPLQRYQNESLRER